VAEYAPLIGAAANSLLYFANTAATGVLFDKLRNKKADADAAQNEFVLTATGLITAGIALNYSKLAAGILAGSSLIDAASNQFIKSKNEKADQWVHGLTNIARLYAGYLTIDAVTEQMHANAETVGQMDVGDLAAELGKDYAIRTGAGAGAPVGAMFLGNIKGKGHRVAALGTILLTLYLQSGCAPAPSETPQPEGYKPVAEPEPTPTRGPVEIHEAPTPDTEIDTAGVPIESVEPDPTAIVPEVEPVPEPPPYCTPTPTTEAVGPTEVATQVATPSPTYEPVEGSEQEWLNGGWHFSLYFQKTGDDNAGPAAGSFTYTNPALVLNPGIDYVLMKLNGALEYDFANPLEFVGEVLEDKLQFDIAGLGNMADFKVLRKMSSNEYAECQLEGIELPIAAINGDDVYIQVEPSPDILTLKPAVPLVNVADDGSTTVTYSADDGSTTTVVITDPDPPVDPGDDIIIDDCTEGVDCD
jgi:hypothetical protein